MQLNSGLLTLTACTTRCGRLELVAGMRTLKEYNPAADEPRVRSMVASSDEGRTSQLPARALSNPPFTTTFPVGQVAAALAVTVLVTTIAESGVAETIEVVVVVWRIVVAGKAEAD
jgi:hypothetical protein